MEFAKIINDMNLAERLSVSEWCSNLSENKITVDQLKKIMNLIQLNFGKFDILRILSNVTVMESTNEGDFETVSRLIMNALGLRVLDNLQHKDQRSKSIKTNESSICNQRHVSQKCITVYVKLLDNKEISIKVDPDGTTDQLIDKISKVMEARPCNFRLIIANRKIDPGHSLQYYDIKEGSYIMTVIRVRGGKPIEAEVKIEIKNGDFSFVYPDFDEGTSWHVTAKPGGEIIHKGKKLNYLFWETLFYPEFDLSKGFCVHKEETTAFLERTLKKFNLNDKEICDFVTFWAPRLVESEYSLISFQFERFDEQCPLTVSPKPDHLIRIFMAAKPLSAKIEVEPQEIPAYSRDGYCVVEWGGSIVKY